MVFIRRSTPNDHLPPFGVASPLVGRGFLQRAGALDRTSDRERVTLTMRVMVTVTVRSNKFNGWVWC